LAVLAAILALLAALVIAPLSAAAPSNPLLACDIVAGTFIDSHGATGTFEGCFTGKRLVLAGPRLGLSGDLAIQLSDPSGRSFALLEGTATLPVSRFAASPGRLSLTLASSRVIMAGLQAYVDPFDLELAPADLASFGDPVSNPDADLPCGGRDNGIWST
jgi:hypothetical protein